MEGYRNHHPSWRDKAFLGKDKNRKQRATEVPTKKLLAILGDAELESGRLHALRSEGLITWRWKPFARVHPDATGNFQVHWNPKILAKHLNFDKEAAVEALEERHDSTGAADDVEWCL